MKNIFLSIVFSLLFAMPVFAKDLYVAKNGNDSVTYANNNISNPWLTIDYCADNMLSGDTCHVRTGTYSEKVTISSSGSSGNYKTIQNYTGESPVVDGGDSRTHGFQFTASVSWIKIIGFEIRDATDFGISQFYNGSGYGINNIVIQNNEIHHNGNGDHPSGNYSRREGGIFLDGGEIYNVTIDNNEIHHNHPEGISLYGEDTGIHDITVSNNLLYRNPIQATGERSGTRSGDIHAIFIFRKVTDSTFNDNYIYMSQKSLTRLGDENSSSSSPNSNTFYNNVYAYSGESCVDVNNGSVGTTFKNNIFAYCNKVGHDIKGNYSDSTRLYNNVIYNIGHLGMFQYSSSGGADDTGFQNNIYQGGFGRAPLRRDTGSWATHNYNNYYDSYGDNSSGAPAVDQGLDGSQTIAQWIGPGDDEPNSINVDSAFTDAPNFDFTTAVGTLQNTGNNPSGDCDEIGLCSNFVDTTKIIPYIELTVDSASYNQSNASKTLDHKTDPYVVTWSWESSSNNGEYIIYQVTGGPKTIAYVGIVGGMLTNRRSPRDFRVQVGPSTSGPWTTYLDATFQNTANDDWSQQAQWFDLDSEVSASYIRLIIDSHQADSTDMSQSYYMIGEFYVLGAVGGGNLPGTPPSPPTGLTIID